MREVPLLEPEGKHGYDHPDRDEAWPDGLTRFERRSAHLPHLDEEAEREALHDLEKLRTTRRRRR